MAGIYRAEHIGSLLRPPALLQARADQEAGRLTLEQLREIEDQAILTALEMQRQVGIEVLTDGEYRRRRWSGALEESVEGLVDDPDFGPVSRWHGPFQDLANETATRFGRRVVGGKLRQVRRLTAHESGFLKRHAPGHFKITMPGVMTRAVEWFRPGLTDQFYPTRGDLVRDLVEIMRAEVRALHAEGVSHIQLDSLRYVIDLANPQHRQRMIEAGENLDEALDEVIAADNASLQEARGLGMTVGLHMCRGNNRSAWISQGGYEAIAERAFNALQVDRFLLEYDTERAGGFEPLRFMPQDKVVVLGLISSKDPQLESADQLQRRVDEAAKYVPLEQLALSPQCGFASTAPGNMLTLEEQWRKLELVVETARRIWG